MVAYNKINKFVEDLANKVHNLASDTFKVALTNVAPIAANSLFADLTEIAAGNGYTAGGTAATITSAVQTTGTLKWILQQLLVVTASGAVGPFRYAALYNSTPTSPLKPLIAWYDYGSAISLANTDTFTVAFDTSAGVLTIA